MGPPGAEQSSLTSHANRALMRAVVLLAMLLVPTAGAQHVRGQEFAYGTGTLASSTMVGSCIDRSAIIAVDVDLVRLNADIIVVSATCGIIAERFVGSCAQSNRGVYCHDAVSELDLEDAGALSYHGAELLTGAAAWAGAMLMVR